jgi:hypothetical protein
MGACEVLVAKVVGTGVGVIAGTFVWDSVAVVVDTVAL